MQFFVNINILKYVKKSILWLFCGYFNSKIYIFSKKNGLLGKF